MTPSEQVKQAGLKSQDNQMWETNIKHNPPPNGVMVQIRCDWAGGEYITSAMRMDYKKPKSGQCTKGFRSGWRWVWTDGTPLTRKESPSAWRHLDRK